MAQMSATETRGASPFRSVRPRIRDYATAPIQDGFAWSKCASRLEAGEWYLVVFRSVRRELGEHLTLEMHDYGAYIEAQRRSSGLLTYFRGISNERGECLSFCVWSSREEAQRAAALPLHAQAMRMADELYASYSLERYSLRKQSGSARLEFERIPTP